MYNRITHSKLILTQIRFAFHLSYIIFLQFSFSNPVASQSYEISGVIADSSTGTAIQYVSVTLQETNKHTITDSKGYFAFTKIAPGKYTIVCSIIGYTTKLMYIEVPQAENPMMITLKEAIIDINEVVFTATRTEKMLKKVPVLTHVINNTQIQNLGITNVAEAVNYAMPGIDFYNEGSGMTLRMQGLDTKYVLFLIDGERLAGENHGNIDYSRLNTSNIERIEIVKGASSSLYGSSAIGGVINIITHTPLRPVEAGIYSRYSRYNDLEIAANIGVRGKKLSSYTDVVRKSSDGYDLTPGTPDLYTVEPYKINSFYQKFTFDLNEKVALTARGSYFTRERFDVSRVPAHPLYTDYNAGVGGKIMINEHFNISASIFGDNYQSWDVLELLSNKHDRIYRNRQVTGKISGEYKIHGKSIQQQTIIGGTELFGEDMYSERIQDSSKSNTNHVFFVQDEIYVNNKFNMVAGVRTDIHSEFGTSVSPKVSFMYTMDRMNYRATFGYGFRAPSIKERYYDFDLGFLYFKGNKNLIPETSRYTSMSAEFLDPNINVSINLYNNHLKDMIFDVLIDGTDNGFTYVNLKKANIYGIDQVFRVKLLRDFILNGGYSYTYALDMTTGSELTGFSKHSGNVGLEYIQRFKDYFFNISLNGRLYSKTVFRNYIEDTYVFYDDTYPAYSLWKIVAVQEFFNSSLRFTCGVDNLFDYRNLTDLININPGRRYFLSINISCEKLFNYLKQKNHHITN
jgi:outer membrane receptor for ferrienterochelin and colicins